MTKDNAAQTLLKIHDQFYGLVRKYSSHIDKKDKFVGLLLLPDRVKVVIYENQYGKYKFFSNKPFDGINIQFGNPPAPEEPSTHVPRRKKIYK